jgi:hypothetical protein
MLPLPPGSLLINLDVSSSNRIPAGMGIRDAPLAALKADPSLTAKELADRFEVSRQRAHQIAVDAGLRPTKPVSRAKLRVRSQAQHDSLSGASRVAPAFLGAAQELVVSIDLMKRGAHVYRAISHLSPADLIACIEDKIVRIQSGRGVASLMVRFRFRSLPRGAMTYSPWSILRTS